MSTTGSHEVVIGRIGKAHGIKGEVSVEPRTDEPDRRFADGTVLVTRTPSGGEPHGAGRPTSLTVLRSRWHQSRLLVTFEGVSDRTAAELSPEEKNAASHRARAFTALRAELTGLAARLP